MPNKNITLELGRILCADTGTACRVIQQLIEDAVTFHYAANEEDEEYPHIVLLIDAGNIIDVHGLYEAPIDLAIVRAINAANASGRRNGWYGRRNVLNKPQYYLGGHLLVPSFFMLEIILFCIIDTEN